MDFEFMVLRPHPLAKTRRSKQALPFLSVILHKIKEDNSKEYS